LTILVETEEYIHNFKVEGYEYNGIDYNSERYSYTRIGKSMEEIDVVYDYDFMRVNDCFENFTNIDRKRALAGIFFKICDMEDSNIVKHEKVLMFLCKVGYHSLFLQPMTEDGVMVYDPLVLLELGEMRCGQVNRIACDIFSSAGYETRVVQLNSHVIAEIFYDGSWHYFDADAFIGGETIIKDQKIPSVFELSMEPYLIDSLSDPYIEIAFSDDAFMPTVYGDALKKYPSLYYFSKDSEQVPLFYYKCAEDYECLNAYYGWDICEIVEDVERNMDAEQFYMPDIPWIRDVSISKNKILLCWYCEDLDDDILGYRVYISNNSRGWEYGTVHGEKDIEKYVWNRYIPEQYDKVLSFPPMDAMTIDTKETEIELELNKGTYYISIMPYDFHGESVGKKIYKISNELKIEITGV